MEGKRTMKKPKKPKTKLPKEIMVKVPKQILVDMGLHAATVLRMCGLLLRPPK
jgi:hypothetical protein